MSQGACCEVRPRRRQTGELGGLVSCAFVVRPDGSGSEPSDPPFPDKGEIEIYARNSARPATRRPAYSAYCNRPPENKTLQC